MFDIGASELLVIVIAAILVIGPKDMPKAMRTAGRLIGKMRRMSNHFRAGVDEMIRQAEIEEMEDKWKKRNEEIMAKYPTGSEAAGGAPEDLVPPQMEPIDPPPLPDEADVAAEAAIRRAAPTKAPEHSDEPPLPLGDLPAKDS
ncbi:MAG: Sec-independent protein translocase protein TatB [Erythrobacter sp.]